MQIYAYCERYTYVTSHSSLTSSIYARRTTSDGRGVWEGNRVNEKPCTCTLSILTTVLMYSKWPSNLVSLPNYNVRISRNTVLAILYHAIIKQAYISYTVDKQRDLKYCPQTRHGKQSASQDAPCINVYGYQLSHLLLGEQIAIESLAALNPRRCSFPHKRSLK